MAKKKTKSYSEAFRREAVRLADQPDKTAADVARELGIHVGQIYNWRTQFNKLFKNQFTVVDGTNYSKEEIVEICRLRKEIACSRNHFARLLKGRGLRARNGKMFRHYPRAEAMINVNVNVLYLDFAAAAPNVKWVLDIT